MKNTGFELFCTRCGKKLSERLDGVFQFQCPRCKSQIGGETRQFSADGGFIVTVVTATPVAAERAATYNT